MPTPPPVDWVTLRLVVASHLAESAASFLMDEGAPGVLTADDAGGRTALEAPVPRARCEPVRTALERWLASVGDLDVAACEASVSVEAIPPVDWIAVSRRHHRPCAVGRRLLVAPPWEVPPDTGREVLVIEPGMAFGTGRHATTRGCLEAIEDAVEAGGVASALDVGTGSGILALALARLGVPRVVALDDDPDVVPLARTTFARNGAPHVALLVGRAAALRGAFDLVAANLLSEILLAEAAVLAAVVAPGGRLIASGLLDAQAPAIRDAFRGWRAVGEHRADGWCTLVLGRPT